MNYCPRCRKNVNVRIQETTLRDVRWTTSFCESCGITLSSTKNKNLDGRLEKLEKLDSLDSLNDNKEKL